MYVKEFLENRRLAIALNQPKKQYSMKESRNFHVKIAEARKEIKELLEDGFDISTKKEIKCSSENTSDKIELKKMKVNEKI